jgi:hypothetical protein
MSETAAAAADSRSRVIEKQQQMKQPAQYDTIIHSGHKTANSNDNSTKYINTPTIPQKQHDAMIVAMMQSSTNKTGVSMILLITTSEKDSNNILLHTASL